MNRDSQTQHELLLCAAAQVQMQAALQEHLHDLKPAGPMSAASVAWLQALAVLVTAIAPDSKPSASLLGPWEQHKGPLLSNVLR